METTRFVLLVALGLVLTMIYQSWQEDYGVLSVKSNKKGQELVKNNKEIKKTLDIQLQHLCY